MHRFARGVVVYESLRQVSSSISTAESIGLSGGRIAVGYAGHRSGPLRARDTPIAFDFDTADKSQPLRATTSETRDMPPFVFERYTRGRKKWEPRSAWPTAPKSGDWRCTIYVMTPKLVMTAYQYAAPWTTATTTQSQ